MSKRGNNSVNHSVSKKSRLEESVNDSLEVDSEIQISQDEAEVGIIESVSLKNFMCHTRLDFKFGPNVNFIVGRNGSGKSAILTAVVVGLGGKANVTNRGNSVKGFIKNGKNFAEITIKLRNCGCDAFKPELYGKSIIIERRLLSVGGSTYKLKSVDGTVISTKREDLNQILDQFNIQVDNPVSILNQEVSRNFLNAKSAHDKYTFFLKATQLHQMDLDYNEADEQKRLARSVLEKKKEVLPDIKREVDNWEKQFRFHQSLDGLRTRLEALKNEAVWAQVAELENSLESHKKTLKLEKNRLAKLQKKVEESKEKVNEMKARADDFKGRIETINGAYTKFAAERTESKRQLDMEKKTYRNTITLLRQKITEIKSLENDLQDLNKKMEELKNSAIQENAKAERESRMTKLRELEAKREELDARRKTTEHHNSTIDRTVAKVKEDLRGLKDELDEVRSSLNAKVRQKENLKGSKANQLSRFGGWVPELVQKIELAYRRNEFRQKPIGPLGAHISLRDTKWALAVECCIGGLARTFCVDNYEDEATLERLMKETIRNGRRPDIIVCKFENKMYNVSSKAAQSNEYPTVLDVLNVDLPMAANFLIDRRSIENILLIEDKIEAREVMSKRPPKNCWEAFIVTGDQLYPSPRYRYYSSKQSESRYLTQNVDDCIQKISKEITHLQQRSNQLEQEITTLNNQNNENIKEQQSTQELKMRLVQQIKQTDWKIRELKNIEDPEPVDVTTFEEEILSLERLIGEKQEQRTELETQKRTREEKVTKIEDELKEVDEKISAIVMNKIDPLKEAYETASNDLSNAEHEQNHYEDRLRKLEKDISDIEGVCSGLNDLVNVNTEKASRVCPRVDTDREPSTIDSEIDQVTQQLEIQEQKRGSKEEVTRRYYDAKKKYEEIVNEIKQVHKFNDKMHEIMKKRRDNYIDYRRLISVRVCNLFIMMLKQSKYQGKLEFDHEKELLRIQVQPRERSTETNQDVRGLSGGERSFSTVCFILALWDAMESPFRILDEFDVFMDMVNRRMSMDLMLEVAVAKSSCQYCFLTPQDMSKVKKSNKIRIFKMADPDRNQGVLPFTPANTNNDDD